MHLKYKGQEEFLPTVRTTSVRIAQRCRIILLAGEGLQNKQIAMQMKVAPRMAALWRDRFLALVGDSLRRREYGLNQGIGFEAELS